MFGSEIKLLKRVCKSEENEFGTQIVKDYDFSKPTILVLGGGTAFKEEQANGYAKSVQLLLTGKSEILPRFC
ncbi:MAG: hypothetical protein WCL30_00950 [Pseudomonadota bacterium]